MSTETEKSAPAAAAAPAPVTCSKSCDCGEPSAFAMFVGKAAIVFAAVAIVFYGLGYLFRGGGSVETPDFDDFGPDMIMSMKQARESEDGGRPESPEVKELREKWQKKFEKAFGSLVIKVTGNTMDAETLTRKTNRFVLDPVLNGAFNLNPYGMDKDDLEDLRNDYVDGAYDCFKSFVDFFSKDKLKIEPDDYWEPVFERYDAEFKENVKQADKDQKDTESKDAERARIVTNAMFLLVFAAMVPLLAKIECNTRRS